MKRLDCPSFDDTCPYCKGGYCCMYEMTGDNPLDQCDEWLEEEKEKEQ